MKGETKNLLTIVLTIAGTGLAVIGVIVTLHVSVISQVNNLQASVHNDLANIRERLARIETRLEMTAAIDSTAAPVRPGALTSALDPDEAL